MRGYFCYFFVSKFPTLLSEFRRDRSLLRRHADTATVVHLLSSLCCCRVISHQIKSTKTAIHSLVRA